MAPIQRFAVLTLALLLLTAGSLAAASVRGTVASGANHQPVGRALVVFMRGDQEVARTSTGDDGKFFLGNVAPGTYTVKISRGDRRRSLSGIRVDKSKSELRLEL